MPQRLGAVYIGAIRADGQIRALVAIERVGILAAIAIPKFAATKDKAKQDRAVGDLIGYTILEADDIADAVSYVVVRRYAPDGPHPPLPLYAPAGAAGTPSVITRTFFSIPCSRA